MSKSKSEKVNDSSPSAPRPKRSKQSLSRGMEIALKQLLATYVGVAAAIVGVIVGIIALVFAYPSVLNKVDSVEEAVRLGQFIITTPQNGTSVSATDIVIGTTPYSPELKHYLVVTPLDIGEDFVQDKPVTVYPGGLWTGVARFGAGDVGIGKRFIVRCLATKEALSPGISNALPLDSQFSIPITVIRLQ